MLANDQKDFTAALFDAELPAPENLRDPQGAHAPKRFNVYRNNVIVGLTDAMKDGFPLVERVVGEAFFEAMAREFVRAHPPQSPLLFLYGADFPAFIESFEPAHSVPYLADVARLEYQKRRAYFAEDADFCDPTTTALESLLAKPLGIHPSVGALASKYPIYSIFQRLSTGEGDVSPEAQEVLVVRRGALVEVERAPRGFAEFLAAIEGADFETAIEKFHAQNPDIPLEPLIPLSIQLSIRTA